jgi:hypothetical protein
MVGMDCLLIGLTVADVVAMADVVTMVDVVAMADGALLIGPTKRILLCIIFSLSFGR